MNREFHYYAIYYLAREAGFSSSDSSIIAISSQLVDESVLPWRIEGHGAPSEHADAGRYTEVTQEYSFWDAEVCRNIYRPFHFIPGSIDLASARRKDGHAGPRATTADSPLAREVLIAALRSRSMYRIGIALHCYADTWAHQDFSADDETQNSLGIPRLPAVGHLHALRSPDDPAGLWTDPRLIDAHSDVDNSKRFIQAARMIFRFLRTFLKKPFAEEDLVLGPLAEIWEGAKQRPSTTAKDSRDADYIVDLDIPPYEPGLWVREARGRTAKGVVAQMPGITSGYSQLLWLSASAARNSSGARGEAPRCAGSIEAEVYSGSKFRLWNEAAAAHRGVCLVLFGQRGLDRLAR